MQLEQTKLISVARSALANLTDLYYNGDLEEPAIKTLTELYVALTYVGEDVSSYTETYNDAKDYLERDAS